MKARKPGHQQAELAHSYGSDAQGGKESQETGMGMVWFSRVRFAMPAIRLELVLGHH
jgi:hypothetical protein